MNEIVNHPNMPKNVVKFVIENDFGNIAQPINAIKNGNYMSLNDMRNEIENYAMLISQEPNDIERKNLTITGLIIIQAYYYRNTTNLEFINRIISKLVRYNIVGNYIDIYQSVLNGDHIQDTLQLFRLDELEFYGW